MNNQMMSWLIGFPIAVWVTVALLAPCFMVVCAIVSGWRSGWRDVLVQVVCGGFSLGMFGLLLYCWLVTILG